MQLGPIQQEWGLKSHAVRKWVLKSACRLSVPSHSGSFHQETTAKLCVRRQSHLPRLRACKTQHAMFPNLPSRMPQVLSQVGWYQRTTHPWGMAAFLLCITVSRTSESAIKETYWDRFSKLNNLCEYLCKYQSNGLEEWKQHLLACRINHNMHTLSPASLESSLWFPCFKRDGSRIGTYFKRNIGRDDLALWLHVCSPHSEMALIKLCNIMAHYMQLKSRDHLFNLVYLTWPAEGCTGMERKERRKWQWPSVNKEQTLALAGALL